MKAVANSSKPSLIDKKIKAKMEKNMRVERRLLISTDQREEKKNVLAHKRNHLTNPKWDIRKWQKGNTSTLPWM